VKNKKENYDKNPPIFTAVLSVIISFVGFSSWSAPLLGIPLCLIGIIVGYFTRKVVLPQHELVGGNVAYAAIWLGVMGIVIQILFSL